MTSVDTQIDLIINKLTRAQYNELCSQSRIDDDQLYVITDDKPAEEVVSAALSSYYKKTETSSASEIQTAFDSIELTDYYKKTETSSATQLNTKFSNYVQLGDAEYKNKTYAEISSGIHLSEYAKTTAIPTKVSDLTNDSHFTVSSDFSFNYDTTTKYIYLKAFNQNIGTVNCADFIKDGMLSTVQLCGNILIFKFNTDAGITPISVNLSSFVDNYDAKITFLSNAITTDVKNLADNYWKKTETSSNTQLDTKFGNIYEKTDLSVKTDGTIKIGNTTITALTAHQNLDAYETKADLTANYYKKTETSSATQLNTKFGNYALTSQVPTKTSQLTNDSGFLTTHQTLPTASTSQLGMIKVGANLFIAADGTLSAAGSTGASQWGRITGSIDDQTDLKNRLSTLENSLSTYSEDLVAGVEAQIPSKTSQLTNDSGFLTEHQSLTAYETKADLTANYYKKTETSSATQINTKLANYALTSQIPTVNNGSLTIKRNGTTLTSFTANQSTNVTADISAVTGITMNGASKGTAGIVDLGTVLTAHQSLDAYETKADLTSNYYKKTDTTLNSNGQIKIGDTTITALTAHQSLANYYQKTETSSASQLNTKFSNYVLTGDSDYKNQTYAEISTGIHLSEYAKSAAIPTVNNGTLTIQRNGTTLTSFSANQSNNITANISAVTGITMNGSSKGSSGTVDLGTVLTAHQSLSNYYTKNETDAQISSNSSTVTLRVWNS